MKNILNGSENVAEKVAGKAKKGAMNNLGKVAVGCFAVAAGYYVYRNRSSIAKKAKQVRDGVEQKKAEISGSSTSDSTSSSITSHVRPKGNEPTKSNEQKVS